MSRVVDLLFRSAPVFFAITIASACFAKYNPEITSRVPARAKPLDRMSYFGSAVALNDRGLFNESFPWTERLLLAVDSTGEVNWVG